MVQPLARKLVALAAEFEDAALWRAKGGTAPFLVRVPGLDHPVVASVMGELGKEFGLVAFADERGPERMLRMAAQQLPGREAYGESLVYGFSLGVSSDVVGAFRKVLKAGGYRPRPGGFTPHFMVCEPYGEWRPVRQGEARVIALCIHATLRAFEAGVLAEADDLDQDAEILELTVASDTIEAQTAPEVTWSVIPSPIAGPSSGAPRPLPAGGSSVDHPRGEPAPAHPDPDVEIDHSAVDPLVEAAIRKHYMEWLDEPVPALGGHTPREAVMIVHLRPAVADLIRSFPSLPGPGATIEPPREELLAALGLDG